MIRTDVETGSRSHARQAQGSEVAPGKRTLADELPPSTEESPSASLRGDAHARGLRAPDWDMDDELAAAMGLGDDASLLALAPTAPAPAPAPASGAARATPAPASPAPAKPAKPSKPPKPVPVPSTEEPAQHATWPDVSAATAPAGKEALDIAWIDALPEHLRDSIDHDFSTGERDKSVDRKMASHHKQAKRDLNKAKAALRARIAERLSPQSPKKVSARQIEQDPEYLREVQLLEKAAEDQAHQQQASLEQSLDTNPRAAGKPNESLVEPPTDKISRLEGVARARTDFMSWGIEITGSAEKLKAHYQGIQQVPGRRGLWLAADAAARFAAAVAAFEAANPGYTIGSSGGQAMRRLHQDRKGLGMHGHSLGLAIDILAYDNPNLDAPDDEPAYINHFFLERFGRDEQGQSRATMNLGSRGDERIETLGKHTIAGATTADDEALVQTLRTQFAEISGTSKRFQASIASQLPLLREARNKYFRSEELGRELEQLRKKIETLRKQPRKEEELKQKEALAMKLEQERSLILNPDDQRSPSVLIATAFRTWTEALQGDRAQAQVNLELARSGRAPNGRPAAYFEKEIRILDAALDKLQDPQQIFGSGAKQKDGTYESELRVTQLPLIQYIERGSIRDDAMPPTTERRRKGVFNAEVVAVLGRYGFAPGSTFGDTMHFDFIEGYTNVAPGGRSGANMQPKRYGPRGTLK